MTDPIKAAEVATRAAIVIGLCVVGYYVWRYFNPKSERVDILPPPPKIVKDAPGQPPPPVERSEAEGIRAGGLTTGLVAQIVSPPKDGSVMRSLFTTTAPVVVEIVNHNVFESTAQVEIIADFVEYTGEERPGIRTMMPPRSLSGGRVARFTVPMETGNRHTGLYELGQSTAIVRVKTNGIQTQATSFKVT